MVFKDVFAKLKDIRTFIRLDGRACRSECWSMTLCLALPVMLLLCLVSYFAVRAGSGIGLVVISLIVGALALVMFPVSVRRLHDIGLPGWVAVGVMFVAWIPYLCLLTLLAALVLFCIPGKREANAYGASPLAADGASVEGKKEPVRLLWACAGFSTLVNVIMGAILTPAV